MKRALQERAKRTIPQPPPSTTNNTNNNNSSSPPPRKMPRITTTTTTNKKRQRPTSPPPSPSSSSSSEEEDEEQKANAFYLKHQNSALSSELKSLKHSLKNLNALQKSRKSERKVVEEYLVNLEEIWNEMEFGVCVGIRQILEREGSGVAMKDNHASKPKDKGGGTSITTTTTTSSSSSSNHRKKQNHKNNEESEDEEDEEEEEEDTSTYILDLLSKLSTSSSPSALPKDDAATTTTTTTTTTDLEKEVKEDNNNDEDDDDEMTNFITNTKNRASQFRDSLVLLLEKVLTDDGNHDISPYLSSSSSQQQQQQQQKMKMKKKEEKEKEEVVVRPKKRGRPGRPRRVIQEEEEEEEEEQQQQSDENDITTSTTPLPLSSSTTEQADITTKPFLIAALHQKIISLQNQIIQQCSQMKDLKKAREEAVGNEWKVRRGLYRIASGRMNIKEVLKAVEKGDNGASFETWFETTSSKNPGVFSSSTSATTNATTALTDPTGTITTTTSDGKINNANTPSTTATTTTPAAAAADGGNGEKSQSTTEITKLQKKVQDLTEVTDSRDKKIKELLKEREEHLKRINSLLFSNNNNNENTTKNDNDDDNSTPSEEEIKKSSLYIKTAAKLVSAQRQVNELKLITEKMKERWGITKGDLENAKRTILDMEKKHSRRWKILTEPFLNSTTDGETKKDAASTTDNKKEELCNGDDKEDRALSATIMTNFSQLYTTANKTVELEHKLRQALEGTRQVDMLRSSLADAHKMNESLQSKLDELRAKNAKFVAEKSAARASDSLGGGGSDKEKERSSSSTRDHSSSSGHRRESGGSRDHSSTEKLQRDNRRLKKELVAALGSKDSARAKQERAEKERDSLMKTNARVLKQSSEKDDMNQKSLSTILHLKSVTEELIQEKEILERKAKDAQQLALAARLVANAKERVGEEALKEKEIAEEQLLNSQKQLRSLMEDKDQADGRLSQSKSQMISLVKELSAARQRCDELAAASTANEEEKQRLKESLAITKKEASESAKKAASAAAASSMSSGRSGGVKGGVNSEFTAEQLTTQVKVLKSRLACPVCNDRDKKCILLRCRHMFCHQCVDKNIKNRSRKCPACGQRFDMKDVGDVWL